MSVFRAEISEGPESTTVALHGELDISTAPDAEREVQAAERSSPSTLILDLRGLEFMDSTGLRLVLAADSRARLAGRRLTIVSGPPHVHRVFLIALLDKRLEFVDVPPDGDAS